MFWPAFLQKPNCHQPTCTFFAQPELSHLSVANLQRCNLLNNQNHSKKTLTFLVSDFAENYTRIPKQKSQHSCVF